MHVDDHRMLANRTLPRLCLKSRGKGASVLCDTRADVRKRLADDCLRIVERCVIR